MDKQLYQYHPAIGYHFIPNLRSRLEHEGGGYLMKINEMGFRSDREFFPGKTANKKILLFGDSFTAGMGVSNKHCYSALLEGMLSGTEIYNFAMPGTGTDQHYLIWQEFAKGIEADALVIAVQVENIRRVAARHRLWQDADGNDLLLPKPYFELDAGGKLSLHHVPVPKTPIRPDELPEDQRGFVDQGGRMLWLRNIINKMGGRVKEIAQQVSHYQPLPEYDDPEGREWKLMKAILREWSSKLNIPVVIFPIPLYQYVEQTASPDSINARFEELAEWENVVMHNPLEEYFRLPKSERRAFRFETDLHPTIIHHQFLAGSLAPVIRRIAGLEVEGAFAK